MYGRPVKNNISFWTAFLHPMWSGAPFSTLENSRKAYPNVGLGAWVEGDNNLKSSWNSSVPA
jgi:hypothetical protein